MQFVVESGFQSQHDMNNSTNGTADGAAAGKLPKAQLSWTVFPVLFAFFAVGFFVLRWVQRKTRQQALGGILFPHCTAFSWPFTH